MHRTLVFAVLCLLVMGFPHSVIESNNIEFNALTSGSAQSYSISFISSFSVIPNMGLAWTGMLHNAQTGVTNFGWEVGYSSVTLNGANLTVIPDHDYTSLKFRYIATQGDRLQVFLLRNDSTNSLHNRFVPFNYLTQVKFDTGNLPKEVLVGTFISGFRVTSLSLKDLRFSVVPGKPQATGSDFEIAYTPQLYTNLYGSRNTFLSNGTVVIIISPSFRCQFTLFLHRVSPSTEIPPSNGNAFVYDFVSENTALKSNVPASFQAGSGLVGIVGHANFWQNGTTLNAVTSKITVNFTSPQQIAVSSIGYEKFFVNVFGLFYSCPSGCSSTCGSSSSDTNFKCFRCPGDLEPLDGACNCPANSFVSSTNTKFQCTSCHSTCKTCNGPFASHCLTCPSGSSPVSGSCTCPNGCICNTPNVCSTCTAKSHRLTVPNASNQCPCVPGFYEDLSGMCVPCPPSNNCQDCQLSAGKLVCQSCMCSRELVNGACLCAPGYYQDPELPGPHCRKMRRQ